MEQRLPFHQQLKFERERRGWSQTDLAEKVGSDTKTVHRWENGKSVPRPYFRQMFTELFGKSVDELGLAEEFSAVELPARREDWGEAPLGSDFFGREQELLQLTQWVREDRCQIVAILGIGGIGKTALSTAVARRVRHEFEYVFWRSLQNAPSLRHILQQCLQCLSGQQRMIMSESIDEQLLLFMQYLQDHRCLLVLDNVESIMEMGQRAGQYKRNYEDYGHLFRLLGTTQHQSCLLLTSREKPKEVVLRDGRSSAVRSLPLEGIESRTGREMLKDQALEGSEEHWQTLINRYSGNPLALKLVSEAISGLFGGDIARFLQEGEFAFGDIDELIGQQFWRLSAQEREILYWLAIEREPVSLEDVYEDLVQTMRRGEVLGTLGSLYQRFLIEIRGGAQLTLQPVIMEYVTNDLVKRACEEFCAERYEVWKNYAFVKAQSKDYVRESQQRLLLKPIVQQLVATFGEDGIEQRSKQMLTVQRQGYSAQPGYLAANVLHVLISLGADLQEADFSRLMIRQAYLQDVALPRVKFAQSHFVSSTFLSTFGKVLTTAWGQGQLLAMGTATGEIWIYQALHGVALKSCRGHTDGVWSLSWHPNGNLLASSSDDQTIRLWNSITGECLKTLRDHTDRVRAVAFSPDGTLLASGSDDQTVRLWHVHTWRCLSVLPDHLGRVWSVAFSPDGLLLATGCTDQLIRLWDVQSGQCLKVLEGHENWVRSIAFRPDGKLLVSGSDDQTVRLWDVETGQCLHILEGHGNRVWTVAFHPVEPRVVSGSEDQDVRLWDVETGQCLRILPGHMDGVRTVSVGPDGKHLISGGDDQTVRLWDVSSGSPIMRWQGYANRVWYVHFHGSTQVVSSSEDHTLRVWNVSSKTCTKMIPARAHRAIIVVFSPDGSLLASGGEDQVVCLWEVATGKRLWELKGHTNWVRAVAFHPAGKILASGGEDHMVRLWHVETGQVLSTLEGHDSWIRAVAFHPNGSLLASAGDDQTIRLWDVESGSCLAILEGHTGRVRAIAISPDGKLIASGSEDQTVRLWEVSSHRCIKILCEHTDRVRSVAFRPDGVRLASAGDDQTIRLWDVASGECLRVMREHSNHIRSVTFATNGLFLASGSDDGTIKLWSEQTARCLATLISERPYEGMDITGVSGLTEAQQVALRSLGAIGSSG